MTAMIGYFSLLPIIISVALHSNNYSPMRPFFFSFLLVLPLLFAFSTEEQTIGASFDDDVIEITITENLPDINPLRFPSLVPLRAYYYVTASFVDIVFLDNLGDVTITLTNLSSGVFSSSIADSSFGGFLFPITLGSGNYRISFVAQGGASYEGYFSVD